MRVVLLQRLHRYSFLQRELTTQVTALTGTQARTTSNMGTIITNEVKEQTTKPDFQLTPVQSTSLLVAYWRDLETRNPFPLIQDPTAQVLVDALLSPSQRQKYDASPIRPYGLECLAVRTRAMDDWLAADVSSQSKQKRQLVNLGAGMCCRYVQEMSI